MDLLVYRKLQLTFSKNFFQFADRKERNDRGEEELNELAAMIAELKDRPKKRLLSRQQLEQRGQDLDETRVRLAEQRKGLDEMRQKLKQGRQQLQVQQEQPQKQQLQQLFQQNEVFLQQKQQQTVQHQEQLKRRSCCEQTKVKIFFLKFLNLQLNFLGI